MYFLAFFWTFTDRLQLLRGPSWGTLDPSSETLQYPIMLDNGLIKYNALILFITKNRRKSYFVFYQL